jgi:hypothetical protein
MLYTFLDAQSSIYKITRNFYNFVTIADTNLDCKSIIFVNSGETPMTEIDKRNKLDAEPFDYDITKDNRVLLYWNGKLIKTLAGKQAQKFISQIAGVDTPTAQLIMARVTGNFKRGNEKDNKS